MKKRLLALFLSAILLTGLTGCTAKERAKEFGGNYTLNLEPGKKLINVTWKDTNFWYLVRDMKEGETPETYEFKVDSNYGIFEGTITIVEQPLDK